MAIRDESHLNDAEAEVASTAVGLVSTGDGVGAAVKTEAGEAVGVASEAVGVEIAGHEYGKDCTSFLGMFEPVTSTQAIELA